MHPATMPSTIFLVLVLCMLHMLVLPGMFAKAHAKNGACTEEEWKEKEGRAAVETAKGRGGKIKI